MRRWLFLFLFALGCAEVPETRQNPDAPVPAMEPTNVSAVLGHNLDRLEELADSIEAALRPVPLLTTAQASALRQYPNARQLAAARRLGLEQPVSQEAMQRHLDEGRLVRLEDNAYWTVRPTQYGEPLVTPDAYALLVELGERFQARIAGYGLPPLRLEITSALRSADNQAALRRVNPNAARGESTHQYGTTVDVTYASFRAPQDSVTEFELEGALWLEEHLRRMERLAIETGASRMALELRAILGHVLREMQDEGMVMVTYEVLQPVYHMTVARRMAEAG